MSMTLSEELTWRGFVNQTTYKDIKALDGEPITFYWGVDPSGEGMTIGHLAMAMMIRHFIDHGHKAILLVGGATGMIGDPDGKKDERNLLTVEQIDHNKQAIAAEYQRVFAGQQFEIVDNFDWFKDMNYLTFLREVGKFVPMRQMLGREFVQSRLGEESSGISYAEFSYALIQGYDFLHLFRDKGATLQVAGADQWGNSIAGVELIRRIEGAEAHVWTGPLVINRATGIKFGKTESGAIWLNGAKTSPTEFYQFWMNCDDEDAVEFIKIYTLLGREEVEAVVAEHRQNPSARVAQTRLATEVTRLIHGEDALRVAQRVTDVLTGKLPVGEAGDVLDALRREIPAVQAAPDGSFVEALVASGLASSNTEARRFIGENAISVNGQKVNRERFEAGDFQNGRLLIRRGKAFKDSALVELAAAPAPVGDVSEV